MLMSWISVRVTLGTCWGRKLISTCLIRVQREVFGQNMEIRPIELKGTGDARGRKRCAGKTLSSMLCVLGDNSSYFRLVKI